MTGRNDLQRSTTRSVTQEPASSMSPVGWLTGQSCFADKWRVPACHRYRGRYHV